MNKIALDNDLAFFDATAREEAVLFGPDANLWSLDTSHRDALFDEPAQAFGFAGPWYLAGIIVQFTGETDTDMAEGGTKTLRTAEIKIPRVLLEDVGAPTPKRGDVIAVWVTTASVRPEHAARGPLYFDVKSAYPDGSMLNSLVPIRLKLECVSRSDFEPERRLREERIQ